MQGSRARRRRPSAALIVALVALFVALGGPAQARKLIDGRDIRPGTVTSRQVRDRSLTVRDLRSSAVRALLAVPDRSVLEADLADGAVSTRALAPGSVLTGTVADNALGAQDLAPNAAGAEEVADNAIGQGEIRPNGVGASEIADQTIDGGEIIDGGLSARDVGRFAGSFLVDFTAVAGRSCGSAVVRHTAADVAGADISADVILVTPGAGWPAQLTYHVTRAPVDDQFRVVACNPTDGAEDPPAVTFGYVILGF